MAGRRRTRPERLTGRGSRLLPAPPGVRQTVRGQNRYRGPAVSAGPLFLQIGCVAEGNGGAAHGEGGPGGTQGFGRVKNGCSLRPGKAGGHLSLQSAAEGRQTSAAPCFSVPGKGGCGACDGGLPGRRRFLRCKESLFSIPALGAKATRIGWLFAWPTQEHMCFLPVLLWKFGRNAGDFVGLPKTGRKNISSMLHLFAK